MLEDRRFSCLARRVNDEVELTIDQRPDTRKTALRKQHVVLRRIAGAGCIEETGHGSVSVAWSSPPEPRQPAPAAEAGERPTEPKRRAPALAPMRSDSG